MRSIALALTIAALALIAAGCGDDSDGGGDGDAAATTEETTEPLATEAPPPEPKGTVVKVSGSEFGPMLFGSNDQAIYPFEKESGSKSECYGECAEAWPPVLTKGGPVAAKGADQGLLGTTRRNDGST